MRISTAVSPFIRWSLRLILLLGAAGPWPLHAQTAAASSDPCATLINCSYSAPLLAQVVGSSTSRQGNNHFVSLRVSFRNLGDEPLALCYRQKSGEMSDDRGERYIVDWRYEESVQGMPIATRHQASTQFVLAPGASRTASFRYQRYVGKVPAGSVFQPSLVVEQYRELAGGQLEMQRDYALYFGEVRADSPAAATADGVRQLVEGLGALWGERR